MEDEENIEKNCESVSEVEFDENDCSSSSDKPERHYNSVPVDCAAAEVNSKVIANSIMTGLFTVSDERIITGCISNFKRVIELDCYIEN